MPELNPDAVIVGQLREHWQKMAALLVWKLKGRERVRLTIEDMQRFLAEAQRGEAVLLTHGHPDSIEFAIVTEAEARQIAEHDRTTRGTA